MEYNNDFTGVLFKNDKKTTENQPNYTGNATIGGNDFWLSCWLKTSKKGTPFMSLSFTPKEDREPVAASAAPAQEEHAPF